MEYPEVNSDAVCEKCLHDNVSMSYYKQACGEVMFINRVEMLVGPGEYILRACQRCDYSWIELPYSPERAQQVLTDRLLNNQS